MIVIEIHIFDDDVFASSATARAQIQTVAAGLRDGEIAVVTSVQSSKSIPMRHSARSILGGVLIIGFLHPQHGFTFAAHDEIRQFFTTKKRIIVAVKAIFLGLNHHAIGKNDLLIRNHFERFVDDPIATHVVYDELGNAGADGVLQTFGSVVFVESPPTGARGFERTGFDLRDLRGVVFVGGRGVSGAGEQQTPSAAKTNFFIVSFLNRAKWENLRIIKIACERLLFCSHIVFVMLANVDLLIAQKIRSEYSQTMERYASPGLTSFYILNHEVEKNEMRRQVEELKGAGFRGIFMHPRPGITVPYLADEWWEIIDFLIETCRELELEAWIYDENFWPSGGAGGKTVNDKPEFRARNLEHNSVRAKGGEKITLDLPAGRAIRAFALRLDESEKFTGEMLDISSKMGWVTFSGNNNFRHHHFYYPPYEQEGNPHWRGWTDWPSLRLNGRHPTMATGWRWRFASAKWFFHRSGFISTC